MRFNIKYKIVALVCCIVVAGMSLLVSSCSSSPSAVEKTIPDSSKVAEQSLTPSVSTSSVVFSPFVSPAVRINLKPEKTEIKKGDIFTVSLIINASVPCRGAQWKLHFSPSVMQFKSMSEGTFFKDWAAASGGTTIVFPEPRVDSSGTIPDMGIAVMTSNPGGAKGDGIIAIYTFTALTDGAGVPEVSDFLLYDENGLTIPVNIPE